MSNTRTTKQVMNSEEWKELGEMLKDWEPYTEYVKKRSKSEMDIYLQCMYDIECSRKKRWIFILTKWFTEH